MKKSKIMKYKKIIGIVLLLNLGLGLMGCASTTTTHTTTTPTTTVVAPVAQTWQTVKEFKGGSLKNTAPFTITSNEWRIVWMATPSAMGNIFQIYVNDTATGGPAGTGVAANIIGKGNDINYMTGSGSGTYDLVINSTENYDITIEQLK